MEKQFKLGDLVRMDFGGNWCPKYGVVIDIGMKTPPTVTWNKDARYSSPYISVMWMGKDRKHTIYKRFLKKMWENVEVIANA